MTETETTTRFEVVRRNAGAGARRGRVVETFDTMSAAVRFATEADAGREWNEPWHEVRVVERGEG